MGLNQLPVRNEVVVRKSPIHGLGVFALRAFQTGEIVLRWDLFHILSKEEYALLPAQERRYTHPIDGDNILVVQSPERYVNHSCNNNTVVRDFSDVAVRHIAAGEEITSDYSSDGSASKLTCSCGAQNCRGIVS